MDKEEIIRRLKRLAEHAVNVAGEPPYFILSLDDGIALHEAIRLLNEQEERIKQFELERSEMNIRTKWESDEIRNKIIELQKNCPMVEWEQDMGKTIPCCKLYKSNCNGQCTFKEE